LTLLESISSKRAWCVRIAFLWHQDLTLSKERGDLHHSEHE